MISSVAEINVMVDLRAASQNTKGLFLNKFTREAVEGMIFKDAALLKRLAAEGFTEPHVVIDTR
jgi:hypothetical protein